MRLRRSLAWPSSGPGPGGLTAAKHLIEAGFAATVFEASDDLGGQWHVSAPHSGVWPGMRTNTSRAMTAFSDFAVPPDHELHPRAEQIHACVRSYASAFDVTRAIRTDTPGVLRRAGLGGARRARGRPGGGAGPVPPPYVPPGLGGFTGRLLHAFDYSGVDAFREGRSLVYGNGVSGHEIAADIATVSPVISSYRKPRYVLQKCVDGVSSDWQWYTYLGTLQRRSMTRNEYGRMLRDRLRAGSAACRASRTLTGGPSRLLTGPPRQLTRSSAPPATTSISRTCPTTSGGSPDPSSRCIATQWIPTFRGWE